MFLLLLPPVVLLLNCVVSFLCCPFPSCPPIQELTSQRPFFLPPVISKPRVERTFVETVGNLHVLMGEVGGNRELLS